MTRFIPREKLGKRARKEMDARKRQTWSFSPVTRTVESEKKYNRKREKHALFKAVREIPARIRSCPAEQNSV